MSNVIAITGKGGTGKTTTSSLIIRSLMEAKAGAVLAVDADPNSTLAEALGLKVEDTISSICEETLKEKDNLPAGMSKDRYLEYRMHQSIVEKDSLSLLTMGRPEGPGCYCYVNNLLKEMIKDLIADFPFTVIDNEAGMEHISRKTMRKIDTLFLISDYSAIGVRSAARIYNLVKSMEIKLGKGLLIVNKAKDGVGSLDKEIKDSGLTLAGILPFDTEIEAASLNAKSVFDIPSSAPIVQAVNRIIAQAVLNKS